MGTGADLDVSATQANEFRCPQPGLQRHQQHGAVAPSGPGLDVGRSQQGLGFSWLEEIHGPAVVSLSGHGQDPLSLCDVLRFLQGDVAEEGTDRGQPRVASTRLESRLAMRAMTV